MAKEKISATIDSQVLSLADADAAELGLNRSELVERALRNEHLRLTLAGYTARTVPTLNIDAYAAQVYAANLESGL
ncbi:ribbon-helix-helix protein, CopG family [Micromonospora sp. NPDC000089]|uniref:ribbon-helix-helix protein, CopG family n=1 Tax=unclassified Micromonospora TaxID=2617518 RepID=UPI003678152C